MPRYHLRTLGGLALARTDQGSEGEALSNSKALLILAFLATRPDHTARRSEVAELLWPESGRPRALRALRQALFFLSRHAGEVLRRSEESLALDADLLQVDLWEFERAVSAEDHAAAIALYGGPFAAGLERKVGPEAEHWIESVNSRLAVGLEVAYVREIARASAEGDGTRAVGLARSYAALNPLDEQRQRLLARTLVAAGDQVGALQVLEEYRQVSVQALGEAPPADLEARLQAMREELLRVPTPAPAPAALPAPAPARRISQPVMTVRGHPVRRATLVAAAALVVAALAVVLAWPRAPGPAASPLAGVQARLLAVAQNGSRSRVLELTVRGASVTAAVRSDLQPADLPAPDGRAVAVTDQAPDGWNLAVRRGTQPERVLTSAAGDEYPVEWSPDGRYVIYAHRRLLDDGRTQSFTLMAYDLAADTAWRLSSLESAEQPAAAWSPDGTRIAFTADVRGSPDVFVVDFNGGNLRDVTRHPAWDGEPDWSPDGERIAFVSRRSGNPEVYSLRPDGTDLARLTSTAAEERRALWLGPAAMAVLAERDETPVLRVLDTFTGQLHDAEAPAGLVALVARRTPRPPWLDRLAIAPRVRVASPGQLLALGAQATGPDGKPLPAAPPVEWSVTNRAVARVDGPGRLRILEAGRTEIVAHAAGWRADTLTLFAVPLAERAVTAAFAEDWRGGLSRDRWRPFGDPPPVTRPDGGPDESGVFANNGDEFFASGAVSVQTFPLEDGLGVEVDGRLPFTGKLHQEFAVALYAQEHPDSVLASGAAPALVELRVVGSSGAGPAEAWIVTPERRHPLPVPEDPGAWHRYVLQVAADGGVELIVDGRMLWRAPTPLPRQATAVRVGLGFQSMETEILHGRLRVFTPPRYYLPEIMLDVDTLAR